MPKIDVGWHHTLLGIPRVWDRGQLGAKTRVAILDSGQARRPGLDRSTFEYLDDRGKKIDPIDLKGHGTACASVVGSGLNGALGMAPKAAISSYRVLDAGDLATKAERALAAIAARDDIDVVLCAFVLDNATPGIVALVRTLALKGVVVVASAGNKASASSAFPERTPHAICVAGLTKQRAPLTPVGFHATRPICNKSRHVGLFFSILNVGNLVSQRLDDDLEEPISGGTSTVSPEQSDDLAKVFSPGVFGTISVWGPLGFGLGMQLVPSARDVERSVADTTTGQLVTDVDERAALQVIAFLGIDVTIFPF
jgi:subtilisin family serine protease